jgi:hypothetical protein
MDKIQAEEIVKNTFENKFDEKIFEKFIVSISDKIIKNDLNRWEENINLRDNLKSKISKYKTLGKIITQNKEEILVTIVKLKSHAHVEKSRLSQRLLAKDLLEKNNAEACLIAFYEDNADDWRFSLVSIDYTRDTNKSGNIIIKKNLSALKRHSYLVGKNEPSYTAKSQLVPIIENKIKNLDQLVSAFSLEKISDEFFESYKDLCFKISDELKVLRKKDSKIDKDFTAHFLTEIDFSKKLMGQIIFLYFIQKKGWIGLTRNNEGNFIKWGAGPKNFLRLLFEKKFCNYNNFYNDVLEDLFYIGLSTDHPDNYFPKLDCKLPFLNGGLFEPINDYNWKETNITISNKTVLKILDTFDLFNFTVNEDQSLEKEIAIDPETIGKVFENLIEENLRRGDGIFYTPRLIVDYMCQSSLASYLKNNLTKSPTYLEIKKIINEICLKEFDSKEDLDEFSDTSKKFILNNLDNLDDLFSNVKICDPAIGSGAFPVTMMQIVVKSRKILNILKDTNQHNLNYKLKLNFIHKCIYGVDIDKSAVEIAKLRLWLSLTIDENNYEKINTLPNLDYKILQGNSLFDDFGGSINLSTIKKNTQLSFDENVNEKETLINQYFEKIKKYNLLVNQNDKKIQREEINLLLKSIILEEIKNIKNFDENNPTIKQLLINLDDLDKKITDFFCWNIIFNKIFKRYGGFDIILANPPYIRQEEIVKYKYRLENKYSIYNSTSDLYTYFFELAKNLLNKNGTGIFITSNKWMRAKYGKKLRILFKEKLSITEIMNFGDNHVFENADTNTNICLFENKEISDQVIFYSELTKNDKIFNLYEFFINNKIKIDKIDLDLDNFHFLNDEEQKVFDKINKLGKPLSQLPYKIFRGILTGFNEGFIVSEEIKKKIILKNSSSKKLFKPILRGRDISKNNYEFANKWMITIPSGWTKKNAKGKNPEKYFNENFPEIINHLKDSGKKFKNNKKISKAKGLHLRGDQGDYWWELRDCDYYSHFEERKIIWIELSEKNKFSICKENFYLLAGAFMMIGKDLDYMNAFLNSNICLYMFGIICNSSGMSTPQWKKFALEKINVPMDIDNKILKKITKKQIALNSTINQNKKDFIQNEINTIFYNFFKLTKDEINIVEKNN